MSRAAKTPGRKAKLRGGRTGSGTRAVTVPSRWSIARAARNGAWCGALISLARVAIGEPGAPAAYYIGATLGWAVVGSLLGVLIAIIKNAAQGKGHG